MQHFQIFGVRIVAREGVVQIGIERHHLATDRLQHLRRERAGGAVATGAHHLDPALELRPVGQISDVAIREVLVELVRPAAFEIEARVEHDVLQPRHLVGTEGERAVGAHLHAGPAIVVMRCGDHGDARHVEIELREIGHRRHRQADVVHLAARRHQPGNQRHLHRRGITAKIMPGDDLRLDPEFADQGAEPHAERLHAHQVDFFFQEPARVVFAEAGRLHQRGRLIGIGIGRQRVPRLRKHQ